MSQSHIFPLCCYWTFFMSHFLASHGAFKSSNVLIIRTKFVLLLPLLVCSRRLHYRDLLLGIKKKEKLMYSEVNDR